MKRQDDEMKPVNDAALADLSISEMEARLAAEELDPRTEMWTGCNCVDFTIKPPQPTPGCPPVGCSCVAVGTW